MNAALSQLAEHGPLLLAGSSLLLAMGSIAAAMLRSPIHRLRLAELTISAVLLWLLLACVPLPRAKLASLRFVEANGTEAVQAERPSLHSLPDAVPPINKPDSAPTREASFNVIAHDKVADAPRSPSILSFNPQPSTLNLPLILSTAYLAGTVACCAWLLLGALRLSWTLRNTHEPAGWLIALYESLTSATPWPHPRLVLSGRCSRPFSFGLRKPTVVLPADCCDRQQAAGLRQVLLHELGHIRQRDAWGQQLFNFALLVLYFHPLYWWLRSVAALSRELIADDWAASHTNPTAYAEQLIGLVRARGSRFALPLGSLGLFSSTTQFYRRMKMLIERDRPLATSVSAMWRVGWAVSLAAVVGLGAWLFGIRDSAAQPAEEKSTAKQQPRESQSDPVQQELERLRAKLRELEGKPSESRTATTPSPLDDIDQEALRQQTIAERQAIVAELEQRMSAARQRIAGLEKTIARKTNGPSREEFEEVVRQEQAGLEQMREQILKARTEFLRAISASQAQQHAGISGSLPELQASTSQLDLINLANSYSDAEGRVKTARVELEMSLAERNQSLARIAQVNVRTAERKAALLRRIIESATEAAKAELDHASERQQIAKTRYEKGLIPIDEVMTVQRAVRQAQANLEILKLIVSE